MPAPVQHSAATLERRQRLSRYWAIFVIGWSFIRTFLVWAWLGDYGLNPFIYLVIDLASSIIDAVTTPRMVLRFIDQHYQTALRWGVTSLVAFLLPDLYIFLGTRTLPRKVIVALLLIIAAFLAIVVITVVRKIRKGVADREALRRAESVQA